MVRVTDVVRSPGELENFSLIISGLAVVSVTEEVGASDVVRVSDVVRSPGELRNSSLIASTTSGLTVVPVTEEGRVSDVVRSSRDLKNSSLIASGLAVV